MDDSESSDQASVGWRLLSDFITRTEAAIFGLLLVIILGLHLVTNYLDNQILEMKMELAQRDADKSSRSPRKRSKTTKKAPSSRQTSKKRVARCRYRSAVPVLPGAGVMPGEYLPDTPTPAAPAEKSHIAGSWRHIKSLMERDEWRKSVIESAHSADETKKKKAVSGFKGKSSLSQSKRKSRERSTIEQTSHLEDIATCSTSIFSETTAT